MDSKAGARRSGVWLGRDTELSYYAASDGIRDILADSYRQTRPYGQEKKLEYYTTLISRANSWDILFALQCIAILLY